MKFNFDEIVDTIGKVLLGKSEQIKLALTCLFAGGHLLIEDLPGIGKTTLAKVISKCLGLQFRRIQFTSDMLPGDILGTSIFDQKSGSFIFHQGPIFTQILLADEINRATPKTQSALLEAMEEHQVTIEGITRKLDSPFFVIATQNPLEQSGTFPLPESQLDRFLMRIEIGYPGREAEKKLFLGDSPQNVLSSITSCLKREEVISIQENIANVHISDALIEYLQDIMDYTRSSPHFFIGLSPRAGMSIIKASKSWAYLNGRDFALPEDIQKILPFVIGHRLRSKDDLSEFPREKLMSLIMEVAIP
ncbi:MAG: AAA family ATPase [Desulfobacterales bacterium]|nr:AAA family ATPase [Desulfobacterales bacterium]